MSTVTATGASEIEMGRRIDELENELATLRRVLDTKNHFKQMFARFSFEKYDRLVKEKLQAVSETNHVFVAVQALLDKSILADHIAARDDTQTNEQMRSNLGRESALEDFRNNLLEIWAEANKPIRGS